MKFPFPCFRSLVGTFSAVLLVASVRCPAESDAFDPSSAMRSEPPVLVGEYAFDMQRLIGTQTQIGRHEATEYQRKVAEARARAYVAAQLQAQEKQEKTVAPKHGNAGTPAPKTKKTVESEKAQTQKLQAAKAKLPPIIAVDTPKDERSAPGTKKVMMLWDTRSEKFVNNNAYDVAEPPPVGAIEKFDTYPARYIGTGVSASR